MSPRFLSHDWKMNQHELLSSNNALEPDHHSLQVGQATPLQRALSREAGFVLREKLPASPHDASEHLCQDLFTNTPHLARPGHTASAAHCSQSHLRSHRIVVPRYSVVHRSVTSHSRVVGTIKCSDHTSGDLSTAPFRCTGRKER